MRTLIIHNPCSGFSLDANLLTERSSGKARRMPGKTHESHWHTDEVLELVQPGKRRSGALGREMAYLACSTALEDARHLFCLPLLNC